MVEEMAQKHSWTASDISAALQIGAEFLFVSEVELHEVDDYAGRARAPVGFPFDSHFVNNSVVPASIIVEFALQFSAFVITQCVETKSTPIIGDIRYRALKPVNRLEDVSVVLDQFRRVGGGFILSSSVFDQSAEKIGQASFTYSAS